MKKNYEGKRMDSNRKVKKERRAHKSNSFKFNFDLKKFLRITSKTLATTWIVALVIFFIFLLSVTPAVFDILNTRNKLDAASHGVSISSEEVTERKVAYTNKIQHYADCTNNMQNLNLVQKLQNSAISSIAKIDVKVNDNFTLTVVEFYEIAVVALPLLVFATRKAKKLAESVKENKKEKNKEATAELKLLAS